MTLIEHYVADGETLSHIAVRYDVSVSDLREANPGVRPRFLKIGARLRVPIVLGRTNGR
jgi:LysM repeat protein